MNTALLADLATITSQAFEDIAARLRAEDVATKGPQVAGSDSGLPAVGSAKSMIAVLEAFEKTTAEFGKSRAEASKIAKEAGMKPRGLAGYFKAGLLASDLKADRRWITKTGLDRLAQLRSSSS